MPRLRLRIDGRFNVYDFAESDAVTASGLMPVPNQQTESLLGGHEVFFCGYDATIECPGASLGSLQGPNAGELPAASPAFPGFPILVPQATPS